jgi:amino acid transporter
LFALSVFLEYGCMLPRSGGELIPLTVWILSTDMPSIKGYKVYLEFTYRRPRLLASTLTAVYAVLFSFTAGNCIIFGEYTLYALEIDVTPLAQKSLAVGLITAITIVHGCFLKTGILIQNILGWVKIGSVVFMILTSILVVAFRGIASYSKATDGQLHAMQWDSLWTGSVWNLEILSTSLFKVFYSYSGLDSINNVLNEVKDPVKTLRSVAPASFLMACILYLLINLAYLLVIPFDDIKNN